MNNIVLCGSMKVKDKIIEVSKKLEEMGCNVLLPIECMQGIDKIIDGSSETNHFVNNFIKDK